MLSHYHKRGVEEQQLCLGRWGSCPGSRRRPSARRSAHGRHSLASAVPSDALAAGGDRGGKRRASAPAVLQVRRTFVTSRLSTAYLAAAYAQVVPGHWRRMGMADANQAPIAEATPA